MSCQIQCIWTLLMIAISKRLNPLSHIFASNCNSSISTLWNSINGVQKALELTTLAKNRSTMSKYIWHFRSKNWYLWPTELFEIYLQNHPCKVWYFVKCKCPNSYSVSLSSSRSSLLDLSHCCCCPLPQAPGCTCETHAVRKHAGSSLGHSGIQNLLLLCWLKELCLEYVSNHFGPCHTSLFNWIVPAAIVAAKFKTQLSEKRISTMILTLH